MLSMSPIISVSNLSKTYGSGFKALNRINLDIKRGEIFALLGPNGAGKTTLISIICGIVNPSQGTVTVDGHDIVNDYRAARKSVTMSWPSATTVPEVALTVPHTTPISVVLPAPFGPSSAKISPRSMLRSMFFSAVKPDA